MRINIQPNYIDLHDCKTEIAARLGARYMGKNGRYRIPNNLHALRELYEVHPLEEVKQAGIKKLQAQQHLLYTKSTDSPNDVVYERLRAYQKQDIYFLSRLPHAAIFNEQRTGKTPTSISLLKYKDLKKCAIVAPAGLLLNWEKEIKAWYPELKTIVVKGGPKRREKLYRQAAEEKSFALIMSYDTLKQGSNTSGTGTFTEVMKVLDSVGELDAMMVDEAHNIRNRKSLRTQACCLLGRAAKHRYILTGTPAVKSGHDLWSQLNFLYPDKFSSFWAYVERYFEMEYDHFAGQKMPTNKYTRQEEIEDIIATLSVQRKREEVMKWLPKKQYQTIPVELTQKQAKVYKDVEESFEYIEDGELKIDCPSHLAQLTRLRQVCLAPSSLGIDAPSAKENFLMEWLKDNKEPVIIFSNFTSYLKQLQPKLSEFLDERVVAIHGELSGSEKDMAVTAFQKGYSRVLLGNITAAGTGFTLDRARTTIFLDKAWNPTDNAQAEDRMVPTTEERNHGMTVLSLVAVGTYDEVIDTLLAHKINIIEVINNGGIKALQREYDRLNKSRILS